MAKQKQPAGGDTPVQLSDNARTVLERRYLAKDEHGNVIETPEQLFRRVAHNIAQAEKLYEKEPGSRAQEPGERKVESGVAGTLRSPPATRTAAHPASTGDAAARPSTWTKRGTEEGVEQAFYDLMASLRFLPNSPTLGNAGRPLQQLSACFVLPVEDSMASIFETVKETALIHQSGGGTGFAFSRLRPAGDIVATTGGIASGPVSFMKVFDAATEAIKQGGTRRGANMAILDVHHPDIEAFINVKADMVTLTNFNISVAADEAFMRAVQEDAEYDLVNPRTGEVSGRRRAREVFDQIVANAWQNGDPGLVFLDRINRDNPTPALGRIEATNPCGEQPLLPYESCNLGSINLSRFVAEQGTANREDGERGAPGRDVDWSALAETVRLAVRFLDDVIDMNAYPVEAIRDMTLQTRKIGLGLMGWADMLFRLGIPYDSEEALALAERLMSFIRLHADAASHELALERGPFPAWRESIYGPGQGASAVSRRPGAPTSPPDSPSLISSRTSPAVERGKARAALLRNATRTTVAPTGTLSIIAGCSGGIEPVFSLAFTRQHYLDPAHPAQPVRLTEVNPVFEAAAREHGFYSPELIEYLAAGGSLQRRDEVPAWAKSVFVTAHDIAPEWHVRMQAAFQRHTDNAVSKTINFPRQAGAEDVARAYLLAYHEGCKGITIYRDGSRTGQVLTHVADGEGIAEPEPAAAALAPVSEAPGKGVARRHLPAERPSLTHKFRVGEQEGFVTVGLFEDGSPAEVFVTISKEGSTIRGLMDSVAMLTSYALQYGVPLRTLVDKFRGVHFEPAGFTANPDIPQASSIVDYIFRWLERRFLGEGAAADSLAAAAAVTQAGASSAPGRPRGHRAGSRRRRYVPPGPALPFSEIATGLLCPDCGNQLVFSEGCLICRACGYSKCG